MKPLEIDRDHWRSRWLVLPSWTRLHRIADITWCEDGEWRHGQGVSVCGLRGWYQMPGIDGRMYLPRCAHCCERLSIPRGEGNPYNEGIDA